MGADSILQQAPQKTEALESADLVVAVLAEFDADTIEEMHAALRSLRGPLRIALLSDEKKDSPPRTDLETAERSTSAETTQKNSSVFRVSSLLTRPGADL